MQNDSGHGGYVDKIREETQTYVRKLLLENENLRVYLAQMENQIARLQRELRAAQDEIAHHQTQEDQLSAKLQDIRRESEQTLAQYSQLEQHNANLANLYVASYQLHGTLDRSAVLAAMQEIIVNLIGSEEFGIWERDGAGEFRLIASIGLHAGAPDGAIEAIGRATSDGETYVAGGDLQQATLVACVPLKLDGRITGYIAICRLLAHKNTLEPLDHELFDLLATHAATALYCTALHERVERLTA